jgi:transcriptional regulator with PAS, ATPase and Fis domain
MVEAGQFRADLYYRLKVAVMDIPPLRKRPTDIQILVDHFCKEICAEHHFRKKTFSDTSRELLLQYSYPGNVRELKNIVEYAVLIETEDLIYPRSLPLYVRKEITQNMDQSAAASCDPDDCQSLSDAIQLTEKEKLKQALKSCYWKKDLTASYLGISRTTLWRRMKKYGLLN